MKRLLTVVNHREAMFIIDTRFPRDLFLEPSGGCWIGIDNSTGEARTEEFNSLRECVAWLRGEDEE
ncbi:MULTISPECIES: hypothetical protein [Priestia]|uniref:hypothetical protein n=1 Tax=Priestia TaxID=2800373 RepID=UPI0018A25060|nr:MULTISPECIES: hypothetical protein [Priestia]QTL51182.1 hypothetical protein J5Z55_08905 [Priestia aryabhattai]USL44153.1 hypothetical protein LIS78_08895 [Priestia megaterium]